ncbi:MAG: aspartate aminotransferase family protein [Patescibacteria group bacterium]
MKDHTKNNLFKNLHASSGAKIITKSVPGPKSIALLKKQNELESNNRSYPREIPIALQRGRGAIIEDVDSNKFIDFLSGCGIFNLGHNNPFITEAIKNHDDIITQAVDFPTKIRINFVERLNSVLPKTIRNKMKVNFGGPTGSDVVEAAIKLARIVTGRHSIIAFQGGYHGMTMGALSVTSKLSHRKVAPPLIPGIHFLPFCSSYRCPFANTNSPCSGECMRYFEFCLENPYSGIDKPAAIIIEPIQGEGGTYIPSNGWLERITEIARKNDILVIFDEIQTGFYRTGKMFAFEHTDADPDIITMSKGIGGNGYPLSLILYKKELDVWEPGTHIGTFRGNQIAMAAGLAAMEFIEKHDVLSHVLDISNEMKSKLEKIKESSQYIGDVRGIGMMFGIELVKDKNTKEPFPEATKLLRKLCYENGLIVEIGGYYNNVIRFLPPLTLTKEIAENGLGIFADANKAMEVSIALLDTPR